MTIRGRVSRSPACCVMSLSLNFILKESTTLSQYCRRSSKKSENVYSLNLVPCKRVLDGEHSSKQ